MAWSPADIPDLSGKVALVTGGSAGLGFETARELASHNAVVYLTARNLARAEQAAARIREITRRTDVYGIELDLASFKSIHAAAASLSAKAPQLHILIANAGVFCPPHAKTEEGFEVTVGATYIGHVLLIELLLPALQRGAPARIVFVSGSLESSAQLDWDDLGGERATRSGTAEAANTNALRIMAAKELNRRHAPDGVAAFSCHPGLVKTEVFSKMDKGSLMSRFISLVGPLIGQSAAKGAYSMLYAACAPEAWGGNYYGPGWMNRNNTAQRVPKNSYVREPANWERAYDITLKLISSKGSAS